MYVCKALKVISKTHECIIVATCGRNSVFSLLIQAKDNNPSCLLS